MHALKRLMLVVVVVLMGSQAGVAQDAVPPEDPPAEARQTLEDILSRQAGQDVPREPREFGSSTGSASDFENHLGTLGGISDSEVWDALRFGTAEVTVSAGGAPARVVMQDRGMWWQEVRAGPLATYGGWLLLGTIALLALFLLVRGRIRVEHGFSGRKILRFTAIERFAHWLLAGSFILLALTGLITLFGRQAISLLQDNPATYESARAIYATLAGYSKWIHNNVSWAFMLALVMIFVFWVIHNIPNRHDLVWLAKGGGIIGKGHPPARKFNAGQKTIFWSVIIFGVSISASGLSLLFPFELPMFAPTFDKLNALGVPGLLGMDPYPVQLAPHEEMQFAQLWHSIVSFVLMAIIIAHIYIGSVGMEGAFDAMRDGEVDLNWAREHHNLWVDEVAQKEAASGGARTTPAE